MYNENIDIKESQKYYVAKSNVLIQKSRFTMTVKQNRLMLYLISKIRPNDTGNEVYNISLRDFSKVCNIALDSGKNYEDAKKAIKELADKSVWVLQDDGNEVLLRWLNRVRLNKKTGCFEISFHCDMLPYLYDLKEKYTLYCLDNVLTMNSKYGIRLYELLKSKQYLGNEIIFSLNELRNRLDVLGYKRYQDFRRYVLDIAIYDINECSDLKISYRAQKSNESNSVDTVIFTIEEQSSMDLKIRMKRKQSKLDIEQKRIKTEKMKEIKNIISNI